jgi:predicted  nucleic acid-binding Zn-ribbon protein
MKVNTSAAESTEAAPSNDDLTLMARLSVLHGAVDRVERERDQMLSPLADRRRKVEELAGRIDASARQLEGPGTDGIGAPMDADAIRARLEEDRQSLSRSKAALAQAVAQGRHKLDGLAEKRAVLEESARRLAGGLSPSGARVYASLLNTRKRPFIVPLNGEGCGGCNMRLPSGSVSEIRRSGGICPFCKRLVSPFGIPEPA